MFGLLGVVRGRVVLVSFDGAEVPVVGGLGPGG